MNTSQSENNKRIAKNTIFLYFRMLLTMGVSLYTSRVVLSMLGVEDFGIHSIVGGMIIMFGFLNAAMSGATSRFLAFELGRGNYEILEKTFSAALTVHFIIAGIVFILAQTIGLWLLETKLIIPDERMLAARWVYHLTILSTVISIIQVPYSATIIARERMDIFSYIEILNSSLRLGVVYLLIISPFDKLVFYAALLLCVVIIIALIYKIYCVRKFPESRYRFVWEKEIIKPMLGYSGWNLYQESSFTFKVQGVNIVLNLFYGVALNAAYGIAGQVQAAVASFSKSFMLAVRPQIIKYYAVNNISHMQNLVINSSKFSFLLLFLISFPLILENNFILNLWLKEVPKYAVVFSQLLLIYTIIAQSGNPLTSAIQATGKIKTWCIVVGTLFLLVIPISYFLFKIGYSPTVPMVVNIIIIIFVFCIRLFLVKRIIPKFSIKEYIFKFCFVSFVIAGLSSILPIWIHYSFNEGFLRFILVSGSFAITLCFLSYFIALDKQTRGELLLWIRNKLKDIKK